jgi:hypothetical protein
VPRKVSSSMAATRACAGADAACDARAIMIAQHPVRPALDAAAERALVLLDQPGDDLRIPRRLDQVEIERQMEAGRVDAVIGHQLVDRQRGFADQHAILVTVGERAHRGDLAMRLLLVERIEPRKAPRRRLPLPASPG